MVYLKWKQSKPKKTGTSEGEIFIATLTLLEWRKFTISSGLRCFLRACALILCLCFIHFCIPSAHPTSGHMSMNFNLGLCEYQVTCPRSWSWSAKNEKKKKEERKMDIFYICLLSQQYGFEDINASLCAHPVTFNQASLFVVVSQTAPEYSEKKFGIIFYYSFVL